VLGRPAKWIGTDLEGISAPPQSVRRVRNARPVGEFFLRHVVGIGSKTCAQGGRPSVDVGSAVALNADGLAVRQRALRTRVERIDLAPRVAAFMPA